jgi:hypothetical protein
MVETIEDVRTKIRAVRRSIFTQNSTARKVGALEVIVDNLVHILEALTPSAVQA